MPVYVSISLHIPTYLSTYILFARISIIYISVCIPICQYLFPYLCIYASHSASFRSCWIIRRWPWTGSIWSHCTHRGKSLIFSTFSACFFHCLTIILPFSLTLPISSSLSFSLSTNLSLSLFASIYILLLTPFPSTLFIYPTISLFRVGKV